MQTKKGKQNLPIANRIASKKRKPAPWVGWDKLSPNKSQRKEMLYKCGKKCFLGSELSFPICKKRTCKTNRKGIYSAYLRAAMWEKRKGDKKYTRVKKRARKLLGFKNT